MKRIEIAPGAHLTVVPGEKFKRGKIAVHLVVPSQRENATALALLPHILDRRCAAIPNPIDLSRLLYSLYGADLSSESYTAGPARVVSIGVSGLKNAFALMGEDLSSHYLDLTCNLLFHPMMENGAFSAEDVAIEKEKQTDFLKSEMNDKRTYCLRQGRRKLYGNSPLGIESSGYLEDIDGLSPQDLHTAWQQLLRTAQIEVMVCGVDEDAAATRITAELAAINRTPEPLIEVPPLSPPVAYAHFAEPMSTTQGKLCIMSTSGVRADAHGEMVMRLASALYGGLPTSRLFMNVREKQSLCYYCSSSYGYFSGVLSVDSGVDHQNATQAATAILKELEAMQKTPVTAKELDNAQRYMRSVFSAAKDSPDALINFAFNEWLKGMNQSLDDMIELCNAATAEEITAALAQYQPAIQYLITNKEGA